MITQQHKEMVRALKKSGEAILDDMTPNKMDLLHMSSKLCSESGELMDAIGKLCYYNKDLDFENVVEELGDIEFYLEGLRQILSLDREIILQANYNKLSKRYQGLKYSDEAAKKRADKVTEQPQP